MSGLGTNMKIENPTIALLEKKLTSLEVEERREATVELGKAGAAALPALFRALADQDWRVRKTAVESLVSINGAPVIQGLIQALSAQDNAGARNSAIEGLVLIGAPAVDALLPSLRSSDPDVRKFVVDILGETKDSRAVPGLIERLADDDYNIRVASAEALGKIRDPRAVDALLGCLGQADQGWLDYAAAEALGELGDERALGPLIAALNRTNLREPIIESLGKIGNVSTLGPLIAGLSDPLRIVREASIQALAAIKRKSAPSEQQRIIRTLSSGMSDSAITFLEETLATAESEVRLGAIFLLGLTNRERSIRNLFSILKEEELEEPIAQALRHLDTNNATFLINALADENTLVRRTAARVLGEIGASQAEAPLLKLLQDENGHVRSAAAIALGLLRSRNAIAPLLRQLSDEYESVQESAIQALAAINDDSMLDGLIKDFSTHEVSLRKNIALLLGKFTTPKAIDALAFALKDEEPGIRKAVVSSLANMPGEKPLKSLLLAITDDDPEVRMLAADALGKRRAPETLAALLPLLEDNDLWVRAAAARGLGRVGGEAAGKALKEHLETATEIFLLALVEALGKLRYPEAEEQLTGLAGHPDPEVRKTALAALSGSSGKGAQQAILARLSDPHWSVRKAAIEALKQKRDADTASLLRKIATEDLDAAVRQAAHKALGT